MIAGHEIAEAFFSNSHRLNDLQRAWLRQRGVPDPAIETDPYSESGPIRGATVVFGEHYFDFAVDGSEGDASAVPAFVLICRDRNGVAADVAAFNKHRLSLLLGRAPVIGEQMVLRPRLGEPLQVFDDIWGWLRGGREGVLPLDWRRTIRVLEGVPLCVDTVAFGRIARKRLTRPAPPIFVKIGKAA